MEKEESASRIDDLGSAAKSALRGACIGIKSLKNSKRSGLSDLGAASIVLVMGGTAAGVIALEPYTAFNLAEKLWLGFSWSCLGTAGAWLVKSEMAISASKAAPE